MQARKDFHRTVFIIAVILNGITAWFSTGYHSEDEHHQVIGFAEARAAELPPAEWAWEYDARIRPSALPWIATGVFNAAHAVGIDDPFNKALLLRLLTAALALIAVRGFVNAMRGQLAVDLWNPFILIAYFLWFLPFLHVRFCSETWSGLFVLMGLTTVLKDHRASSWAVRAGALLAIAVWIRPPVALIVLGLVLWMRLVRKDGWRDLLRLAGGAVFVLILSSAVDSLFYHNSTFSILRFVQVGFTGDPNHVFDTLPWYYYGPWLVKYAIPPIGLCTLFAMALLLWKRPQHVLVWCVLPFVVIHSILPHKEVRFLYPLADLAPVLLVLGYQELRALKNASVRTSGSWRFASRALLFMLIACNVPGLAVISSSPAGNGRVDLAHLLHARSATGPVRVAYLTDPQFAWRIHLPHFYKPFGSTDTIIPTDDATSHRIPADLLIAHPKDARALAARCHQRLLRIALSEPAWTIPLLRLYTWGDRSEQWELYTVEKTE